MIRDEFGQIRPMKFSHSQEIMWATVAPLLDAHAPIWVIVLKGRQVYSTTFFQALEFIRTCEQPNTKSLIIAQDRYSSDDIFSKAKLFYEYLPLPKMRPSKIRELVIPLTGGTSVFGVVSAGKSYKGRGTNQTCLHCSEVAFWPSSEVMTGLVQSIPGHVGDTIWVMESTANGMVDDGELFYNYWKSAVDGRSKRIPIFIPWFVMPKYREGPELPASEWDEEERILVDLFGDADKVQELFGTRGIVDGYALQWRRNAIQDKCEGIVEMFHQEYPATPEEAFVSTGLPAFEHLSVLKQNSNICAPRKRLTLESDKLVEDSTGEISVWEMPKTGTQYSIGVDTSEGIRDSGGTQTHDYSCAQVIDMDNLEQVAVVHGLLQPYDFSKLLNRLGRWYNNAIINVEVKNTGWAVQDYLARVFQYPRFHPWRGKPDRIDTGKTRLWGWDTNVYSRPLLIEAGRRAINKNLLTIHDKGTLQEIKQFSRQDNGRYEAEGGHDDRVLALLLALRTREENYTPVRSSGLVLSAPDQHGVRYYDAAEPDKLAMRRINQVLKRKADDAVKSWMEL